MGLRSLSVNEQVALLFVSLFGALLISTIVWTVLSLREASEAVQLRRARGPGGQDEICQRPHRLGELVNPTLELFHLRSFNRQNAKASFVFRQKTQV